MPATENLVTTEWSTLTGLILDGGYEMKEPLALEADSALFKIRILGGWGQEAMVRMYHADLAQAEEQLSFWQTLREWPHPNVSTPMAAGYRWLGDLGVVYVILPVPDEKLSGVLTERPLDEEEASELVRNIASALGHLHACGLAHGSISPETVLAIGHAIQISTDSVRRQGADLLVSSPLARYVAPESEGANNTTAADIWCMGATLFEVLSRRHYDPVDKEQISKLPFSLLLEKCLDENPDTRCNMGEALSIFARGPRAAPPPPPPKPVVVEPVVPIFVVPDPTPEAVAEAPALVSLKPSAEPVVAQETATDPLAASVLATPIEKVMPETAAASVAEPFTPEEPVIRAVPPPPENATTTGAGARVAAAEETRKAAAAGDAFKKTRSTSPGASSILSAPLPSESRHKPAEMKRKPVAAKIRHIGSYGLGLSDSLAEDSDSADKAVTRLSKGPKPWAAKSKPRTWQLAVGGAAILIMLLALIFLVVVPRLSAPTDPVGPAPGVAANAAAKGNAWQTKTLAPPPVDASSARTVLPAHAVRGATSTPAEIASGQGSNGVNNWRLVLGSFKFRKDAERRIAALKRSNPATDPRLFIPARKWPFIVVMGGPVSKETAEDEKKLAIAQGLPRAIYVQRFE